MLRLIPAPTSIRMRGGEFAMPSPPTACVPDPLDLRVAKVLHELFPGLHHVACRQANAVLRLQPAAGPAESYRLRIAPDGITIAAPDAAGFFYALQTLRQIRAQSGADLPCCEINDAPVWPLRGSRACSLSPLALAFSFHASSADITTEPM